MENFGYNTISDQPSIVWVNSQKLRPRIDATYYSAQYLVLDEKIVDRGFITGKLGDYLVDPCRQLYLKTQTYEEGNENRVRFISGVDIDENSSTINWDSTKYVDAWMLEKYPRGRLFPGALLIKVKGPNQLAAYVEKQNFPALVSGTIVFGGVKQDIDPFYLSSFLLTEYAKSWRTRLRQNITVEFTPYEELAEIPIIIPHHKIQNIIGNKVRKAERIRYLIKDIENKFSVWIGEAADIHKLNSEKSIFLDHSPDKTCPDNAWVNDFDPADRVDPWPHHIAIRSIRNHLKKVGKMKKFSDFFIIESANRSCKSISTRDLNAYHISVLDIDYLGHIDWISAEKNRYDGSGVEVYPGDILFSCLNPRDPRVCVIPDDLDKLTVASPEFAVLRLRKDAPHLPFLFAAILRSNWIKVQTSFLTRSSSLSRRRLHEFDLNRLLLPWEEDHSENMNELLKNMNEYRHLSEFLIIEAQTDIEALIDGTLDENKLLTDDAEIEQWLKDNPSPYQTGRKDI